MPHVPRVFLPLLLVAGFAEAADTPATSLAPPVAGTVLTLAAEAQAEVANDQARLVLVAEREHTDQAELARQIAQALDAGVQAARAQAGVVTRNGGYYTHAVTDAGNRIRGYRTRAELVLSGSDFAVLARVAQQVSEQLAIGGMSFHLAPETRRHAEATLIGQAIDAFRAKATTAAQALGARRYRIDALELGGGEVAAPRPMLRMAADAAPQTPLEGGNATVTVTVSGKVQLEY